MRRLIVNADDFGLTSGINRAVLEAHRRGIVTSATLMACGARFDEAVELAASAPTLSVGCHVLLVDARPLRAPQEIPSLLLKNAGGEAQFRRSMVDFACQALARRLDPDEIEAEVRSQIQKLQQAGLP
ncbi:MAG TPA: ChbG/HpnK family deacetylase, partial [Terriglobales bacterium]|nr:ChbG/HpnK family deacetylase [Terriglobales bacterium]